MGWKGNKMKTSVLMNPPFSAKWEQKNDGRFEPFGLAPKTKADFAFLLHGFHQLQDGGTMAIVLPHGVLFRGAAEGKIRQKLLEINAIDAVIGLPANIFAGTSIPTVMIVLKKKRTTSDVLFIDASQEFEKSKSINVMQDSHINKIFNVYQERKDIDKFAHLASFEEIVENDYNLNIPRFVDTFEEEEPIDLGQTALDLMKINQQIRESEAGLLTMLDQLTGNPNVMADIELMKMMLTDDIGGSPSGQARLF